MQLKQIADIKLNNINDSATPRQNNSTLYDKFVVTTTLLPDEYATSVIPYHLTNVFSCVIPYCIMNVQL